MHQNEISKLTAAEFLAKVTPRAPINFGDGGSNFFHMRRGLERFRNLIGHRPRGAAGMELVHSLLANGVKKVWVSLECPDLLHRNDAGRRATIQELKALLGDSNVISLSGKKYPDIDSMSEFDQENVTGVPSTPFDLFDNMTELFAGIAKKENDPRFLTIRRGKHRGPSPAHPYQVAPFHFKDVVHLSPMDPEQKVVLTKNGFGIVPKNNFGDSPPLEGGLTYIDGEQFFVDPDGILTQVFDQDDNPTPVQTKED